jgi:hypothetical protein
MQNTESFFSVTFIIKKIDIYIYIYISSASKHWVQALPVLAAHPHAHVDTTQHKQTCEQKDCIFSHCAEQNITLHQNV